MIEFLKYLTKFDKSKDFFDRFVDAIVLNDEAVADIQKNMAKGNCNHSNKPKKKETLIDAFAKKFANVKLDGDSEDESELLRQDPMENNKEAFLYNSSLYVFHIDSKVRRFCLEISETWSDYKVFVVCRQYHHYMLDLK